MKNYYKNRQILALAILFLLCGCKWISGANRPFSSMTNISIPEGTPLFQKGFRDGCGNAFYARGNGFFRSRYSYRFDGNLAGNTEYRFGISRGYGYCFAYVVGGVYGGPQASFDTAIMPHGYDPTYNANSVNAGWGGFFGEGGGGGAAWTALNDSNIDRVVSPYKYGIDGETSAFDANGIFWGGGSKGQFFGQ